MKSFISFIITVFILFTSTVSYADYFTEEIVGADPEVDMIREITLTTLTFKDGKEQSRYSKTLSFINSIKNEAVVRFEDGTIPLYRRYDIITHLDSFVYAMNQYFSNQKKYEQTRKTFYKESARSYLEDSKGAYNRLRFSLKNSTY